MKLRHLKYFNWISDVYGRQFVCYIHFIGLDNISLGLSVNWLMPNLEIHLPFCYIRFGWQASYRWNDSRCIWGKRYKWWKHNKLD